MRIVTWNVVRFASSEARAKGADHLSHRRTASRRSSSITRQSSFASAVQDDPTRPWTFNRDLMS